MLQISIYMIARLKLFFQTSIVKLLELAIFILAKEILRTFLFIRYKYFVYVSFAR